MDGGTLALSAQIGLGYVACALIGLVATINLPSLWFAVHVGSCLGAAVAVVAGFGAIRTPNEVMQIALGAGVLAAGSVYDVCERDLSFAAKYCKVAEDAWSKPVQALSSLLDLLPRQVRDSIPSPQVPHPPPLTVGPGLSLVGGALVALAVANPSVV